MEVQNRFQSRNTVLCRLVSLKLQKEKRESQIMKRYLAIRDTYIFGNNQFKIFKCQKFTFLNEKISKCIIEQLEP